MVFFIINYLFVFLFMYIVFASPMLGVAEVGSYAGSTQQEAELTDVNCRS